MDTHPKPYTKCKKINNEIYADYLSKFKAFAITQKCVDLFLPQHDDDISTKKEVEAQVVDTKQPVETTLNFNETYVSDDETDLSNNSSF